jgi:hypothetical protein
VPWLARRNGREAEWFEVGRLAMCPALVDIMRDIPCTLIVYNPIESQEVLGRRGPKQAHEVVACVLGGKCTSNESADEDVACSGARSTKVTG